MLRPRHRRDPNELRAHWQQRRRYQDHLGYAVVLEEYITPNVDPEPTEQLAIQVYSTFPFLDDDHTSLRDYLLGSWSFEGGPKPLFEIYSYCPADAFDCIEHNRREIASRKRQHVMLGAANPAPLIPYFFHWAYESPVGCCVLLDSFSYRLGYITDVELYNMVGRGPDWLSFNRTFAHCLTTVDTANRVSSAQPTWFGPRELYPEGFEMEIMHVRRQDTMGQHTMMNVFGNRQGFGPDKRFIHCGLDEYEGEPPDCAPLSGEHIQQQLDRQFSDGNLTLDPTFRVSHGDDSSVTVRNSLDSAAPHLQYLLYVPFLSHLRGDQAAILLDKTARLFTAAIVAHLPAAKTLRLEFRIPSSSSWSAILPAHHDALRHHDDTFAIGSLYTISTGVDKPPAPHRVSPQRRSDRHATAQDMLKNPYRVFAVVLDKPAFVREAGVCFYMAEYDGSNEMDPHYVNFPDTQVWRSAGMYEVARRLAMLAVEEEQNGVVETRRLLEE